MRRLRPSPGTVIATAALAVSLGGTAYAVTALPANSVGTTQLKDRAVTEDELANRAVITRKLATGAVTTRTLAPGAVTGSRVASEALGGEQIDEARLGAVPFAETAERAKLAARADVAERVEHVGTADRAERAAAADVADAVAEVVTGTDDVTIPKRFIKFFPVDCPDATVPVGGGFLQADRSNTDISLTSSAPQDSVGWIVGVINFGFAEAHGWVYVRCLRSEGG